MLFHAVQQDGREKKASVLMAALSAADAQARQVVAAVYLRISKDDDDTRLGVDRQQEDCIAECARRGWTPILFTDNDVSASKGLRRPAYEDMLRGVQRGELGAVVAHYADRLHRSPVELERFIDVVNAAGSGFQVVTIKSGDYDLSTPDGRMVARILGSIAKGEVEKMGAKIARAKLQAAQAGKPNPGGRRPYGFEADKVAHRKDEAAKVRDAAEAIINGISLLTVAARLGMPHGTARNILTSERIAGLRRAGTEVVPAVWQPILPLDVWETVRSILLAPERTPGIGRARRHLLTGFLYCATCDLRLEAATVQGKVRYRCPNNDLVRVAETLDAYVVDRVLAALTSPEVAAALHAQDIADLNVKALAADVAKYEARLRVLKDEYGLEQMWSKSEFLTHKAELEARIDEARRALAARAGANLAGHLPVGSERIRTAWEKGALDERRQLIDVVVEKIVVRAAGRGSRTFRPEDIDIRWRV